MKRIALFLAAIFIASQVSAAEPPALLTASTHRILFLGDSNTYAGQYIEFFEAILRQRMPDRRIEVLNLGLPSETICGLSEPDHPFPRPDLHERLDRTLRKIKPDLVIACYGMNDGIYYPLGEDRFAKFKDGFQRLVDRCKADKTPLLILTPPPFDPLPVKAKTQPAGREKYSWMAPYRDYDSVLGRYSEWLLGQRESGWNVADLHTPINVYLAERRKIEPGYFMAGDGIHPNSTGHWLMARQVLVALGVVRETELFKLEQPSDARLMQLIARRQHVLRDAYLTDIGHKRPDMAKGLPLDEALRQAAQLDDEIRKTTR